MTWTVVLVLALAALLALGACQRRASDRPEDTLRAFLTRLREGRAQEAWHQLSGASQASLRDRAHREAERRASLKSDAPGAPDAPSGTTSQGAASPSAPDDEAYTLLFADLRLMVLGEPESIVLVSPFGPEVTLRVSLPRGRSADFRLVREGKEWKVDLMSALRPVSKI
ncbi:MAG: hypothetical protein IPK13_23870 [Deltaproteobacteria bacterium]|nr:hypothetical protein [Deltaproteobacteria bacterium]